MLTIQPRIEWANREPGLQYAPYLRVRSTEFTLIPSQVIIAVVVFAAALLQTLSGFGFALLAMPLAAMAVGLKTAAPLIATAGLILNVVNLVRHRRSIDGRELLRLTAASVLGVPIGVWALVNVDETLTGRLLGLILIAYGLYALLRREALRPCSGRWAFPAGLAAGCLGGAYNTPGPPVIVYTSLRGLPKEEFRATLFSFFGLNGALVVAAHALSRNLTADTVFYLIAAVPALAAGILLAARLDGRLKRERFHTFALVVILLLGVLLAGGV